MALPHFYDRCDDPCNIMIFATWQKIRSFLKKIFIFFLCSFFAIGQVLATTAYYQHDTKIKIASGWKAVRSILSSKPARSSVQGLLVSTAVMYAGDKVITEYQAGTFDTAIDRLKLYAAGLYAQGAVMSGAAAGLFSTLSSSITCESGNCRKTSDGALATTSIAGVYYHARNSGTNYPSLSAYLQSVISSNSNYVGYKILSGESQLSTFLSSTSTSTSIPVVVEITCGSSGGCGLTSSGSQATTKQTPFTVVVDKPAGKIDIPTASVTPQYIADQMTTLDADQSLQGDFLNYCFSNGCSGLGINYDQPTSIPKSMTSSGQRIDAYPNPQVMAKDGGWVDASTGDDVGSSTPSTNTPLFCDWAKTLCDFFSDRDVPEPEKTVINDLDLSDMPKSPIFSWAKGCPAPYTKDIQILGMTTTLSFSYDFICDFADNVRPFMVAAGYLHAAYIIAGYRREI